MSELALFCPRCGEGSDNLPDAMRIAENITEKKIRVTCDQCGWFSEGYARDGQWIPADSFEGLLEASTLGSPAARQIRNQAPPDLEERWDEYTQRFGDQHE